MMLACRRRRALRIVAFIGVACVIFLCFQLFLIGFLDHDAHLGLQRVDKPKLGLNSDERRVIDIPDRRIRTTEHLLQLQHGRDSECSSFNCSIAAKWWNSVVHVISKSSVLLNTTRQPDDLFLNNNHRDSSVDLSQFESVWEFLEYKFSQPFILEKGVLAHSTRGVNRRWQYLYEPDDQRHYTCILSQVNWRVL